MAYGSNVSPLLAGFNQGVRGMTTLLGAPGRQRLVDAQTAYMKQRGTNPAMSMAGAAGQYAQLEHYAKQFGVNSPQYQQLYQALMSKQHLAAQRGNYYSALTKYMGLRYSTQQQRTQANATLTSLGYPVTTINTLNDGQRAAIVQQNIPYSSYLHQTGGEHLIQGASPQMASGGQLPSPQIQGTMPANPTGISPAISPQVAQGGLPPMAGAGQLPQQQATPMQQPMTVPVAPPMHPQGAPGLSPSLQGFQQPTPGISPPGRTIEAVAQPEGQAVQAQPSQQQAQQQPQQNPQTQQLQTQ